MQLQYKIPLNKWIINTCKERKIDLPESTEVHIELRDDTIDKDDADSYLSSDFRWNISEKENPSYESDIVAYRITKV